MMERQKGRFNTRAAQRIAVGALRRINHDRQERLMLGRPFAVRATFVLSAALLTAAWGCGDDASPSSPSAADALTESATSANIDFFFSQGDSVETGRQEAFHAWVVDRLRIVPPRRLQYRKYRDRSHMQRVTGQLTNGWADPAAWTAHSIWTWDAHEAVHVYTAVIGRPSDSFNEGIAVALSMDPSTGRFVSLWNNTPIDDVARSLQRTGTLPAIPAIVETEAFRRLPEQTSYPAAGSFVSHVLRTSGMDAMRTFFQSGSRADTQAGIASRFSEAFGVSLSDAEASWRAFLGG
jgi:hypothetical protein